MHKPINTSMMHDLIVFIFLLIIYFQMKCSHVMINGKITYKGKEILLLFLLQNGYYKWLTKQAPSAC
jgi:Fe-S cluster assembly ATPase SufC